MKYLDYVIERINDREFFYSKFQSFHALTGFLCAIAQIYKLFHELLDLPRP